MTMEAHKGHPLQFYIIFQISILHYIQTSIVRIEISILPIMLPFHFSTLLGSSDLQTFILPFSISLSSACAAITIPKTMALPTNPRHNGGLYPSSFLPFHGCMYLVD